MTPETLLYTVAIVVVLCALVLAGTCTFLVVRSLALQAGWINEPDLHSWQRGEPPAQGMYIVDIGTGTPLPAIHRQAETDDDDNPEYEWLVVGQQMPLRVDEVHVWVGPIRVKMRED